MALNRKATIKTVSIKGNNLAIHKIPSLSELQTLQHSLKSVNLNCITFECRIPENRQKSILEFLNSQTTVIAINFAFQDEVSMKIANQLIALDSPALTKLIAAALDPTPCFQEVQINEPSLAAANLTPETMQQAAEQILNNFVPGNLIQIQFLEGDTFISHYDINNSVKLHLNHFAKTEPSIFQNQNLVKDSLAIHLNFILSNLVNDQIDELTPDILEEEHPHYTKAKSIITYYFRRWYLVSALENDVQKELSLIEAHTHSIDMHLLLVIHNYFHLKKGEKAEVEHMTLDQFNTKIRTLIKALEDKAIDPLEYMYTPENLEIYLFNKLKALAIKASCYLEIYQQENTKKNLGEVIKVIEHINGILSKQSCNIREKLITHYERWDTNNVISLLLDELAKSKKHTKAKIGIRLAEIFFRSSPQPSKQYPNLCTAILPSSLAIATCFYNQLNIESAINCIRQYLTYIASQDEPIEQEILNRCVKILACSDPVAKIIHAAFTNNTLINHAELSDALRSTPHEIRETSDQLVRLYSSACDDKILPSLIEANPSPKISFHELQDQYFKILKLEDKLQQTKLEYEELQQQHTILTKTHHEVLENTAQLDKELEEDKKNDSKKRKRGIGFGFFNSSATNNSIPGKKTNAASNQQLALEDIFELEPKRQKKNDDCRNLNNNLPNAGM